MVEYNRIKENFMSNALSSVAALLKRKQKIETKLQSLRPEALSGLSVKITPTFRSWLKSHLESVFDTDSEGSNLTAEDRIRFQARKVLIKKNIKGTIVKSRYCREDGVTLSVNFKIPEVAPDYEETILLGVSDVKLA